MKRREIAKLLDELVVQVPAAIRAAGLKPNACILAGRIGVEALRACGVRARPLAVKLAVYNPPAARMLEERASTDPAEWKAAGGRIILVGHGSDRGGWDGHLVLVAAERYLLDLTAAQAARPAEDGREAIEAEPFWIEARGFARGRDVVLGGDDGSLWVYEPVPEDRSFVTKPAWSAYRVRAQRSGLKLTVISERSGPRPDVPVAPEVRVVLDV